MKINEISWGDDSAEKDPFLLNYFVESDSFRRLFAKSKNIVIGRKGSGKSALRRRLEDDFAKEKDTFVVSISPKYNSLRSILNDKELVNNFGQEIFFQHTWLRQILLDSICKVGDSLAGKFASGSKEFVRQVCLALNRTSKDFLENVTDVLSRIKAKVPTLGDLGLSVEQQLREIAEVDALEFHVTEVCRGGAKIVVMVDDLDLGWDNSPTANKVLLGLLSAMQYIQGKVSNIFLLVFLREDIYSILISKTQHSDKFRNVERVKWDRTGLLSILNSRIIYNRNKFKLPTISNPFSSVFPDTCGTSNTDTWIIDRTLSRPRELIQFSRYYTEANSGEFPDSEVLKKSENDYSSWKLDDLCAEYSNQYPGLSAIFSYWKTKFYRNKYHLQRKEIDEMVFRIFSDVPLNSPWFNELVSDVNLEGFLLILFEIGFIGDFILGGEGGSKVVYSFSDRHEPKFAEVQIHPCFRRAVGTVERIRTKEEK